jgi:hypothetical protein
MILVILLSAAFPLRAQLTTGHSPSQFRLPFAPTACPVGLRADRRASVVSREVDGKPIPTGQGLMLHFRAPYQSVSTPQGTSVTPRHVISADITVHGHTGAVIAQPLTIASANPTADVTEDFHLSGSASNPLTEDSLWTAKISTISWIELTRVTFSDGTSWQRAAPSDCRIEPSLFVLVK